MPRPYWPVYIIARDDLSFREVLSERDLDWYECIDIEEGMYEGWDSSGRHFILECDES